MKPNLTAAILIMFLLSINIACHRAPVKKRARRAVLQEVIPAATINSPKAGFAHELPSCTQHTVDIVGQ